MYLYFIFFILSLLAFTFDIIPGQRNRRVYTTIFFSVIFVLFCLSTFRWENGTDWNTYYHHFNLIRKIKVDPIFLMEPGYQIFTSINKSVCPYYSFHLGIVALIVMSCFSYTILKHSIFPFISLLVWFSISLSNIFPVRQTIAIAILLFSMKYVLNRSFKKFIIAGLLAMSFHASAVIFLPVYFFFYKKFSMWHIIICLILCCCISFVFSHILDILISLFSGTSISDRLTLYTELGTNNFGLKYSAKEVLLRGIINRGSVVVCFLILLRHLREKDVLVNGWLNMYLFAFVLFMFTTPISVAISRVVMYYDVSQIFLFPCLFKIRQTNSSKYILYMLICSYLFLRLRGVILAYEDCYIPYKTVFST